MARVAVWPPPVTVNVYPSRSRFEPVVVVVTVRVPVVAVPVQLTANVVEPVPPAGTLTLRGVAPPTAPVDGKPPRWTPLSAAPRPPGLTGALAADRLSLPGGE